MDDEVLVQRPCIPALALFAFGLWVSCAITWFLLARAYRPAAYVLLFVFACSAVIAGVVVSRSRSQIGFVVLGALIGCALALSCALSTWGNQDRIASLGKGRFAMCALEDPRAGMFGSSFIAEAHDGAGGIYRVRVTLDDASDIRCWTWFEAEGELKVPEGAQYESYWIQGVEATCFTRACEPGRKQGLFGAIAQVREAGIDAFRRAGSNGELMMRAIVFGDRADLSQSAFYRDVKAAGVAHIVAVSGAHLAVMASFVALVARLARLRRIAQIVLIATFVCVFVVFAGAPHSALRAAIMVMCALSAFFARRRTYALNALALCIVAFLSVRPYLALSVSYALSSLATLGIVVFAQYASAWCASLSGALPKALCDICGVTAAANTATIPVTASLFGQISLIAPLTNLVVSPVFALLCIAGLVAACLSCAHAPFASLAVDFAIDLGDAIAQAISLLAHVPYACVPAEGSIIVLGAGTLLACVALYRAWPRPNRMGVLCAMGVLVASCATMALVFPAVHGDEVVMLDVGQGDAFVLRSGNKAVLIDTGTNDAQVLQALARHDIAHLDAVVITHPDDDHAGSLPAILSAVDVANVCVAADLLGCACEKCAALRVSIGDVACVPLHLDDTLAFGSFRARVVWPKAFADEGGNADSVVLLVEADCNGDGAGDWRMLMCGDAESETLGVLVDSGMVGSVDILKVGHHGSRASLDERVCSALSPRIALIGVGAENRYGHPSYEALHLLNSVGCRVFRTDECGDVVCKLALDGVTVDAQR